MMSPEATKFLKRKRIEVGQCLDHCDVLGKMERAGLSGFLLCQGPLTIDPVAGKLSKPMLHCWLESDGEVVDLTRKGRFFDREAYYAEHGVLADEVKRHSRGETLRLGLAVGGKWAFWGFDESKYWVSVS